MKLGTILNDEIKEDPYALSAGIPKITGNLREKPRFVEKVSNKVWFGVGLFVFIIFMVIVLSTVKMGNKKQAAATAPPAAAVDKNESRKPPADLLKSGDQTTGNSGSSVASPSLVQRVENTFSTTASSGAVVPQSTDNGKNSGAPPWKKVLDDADKKNHVPSITESPLTGQPPMGATAAARAPLSPAQQAAEDRMEARNTRMRTAESTGMSVKGFGSDGGGGGSGSGSAPAANTLVDSMKAALLAAGPSGNGQNPAADNGPKKTSGDAEQDEKMDFIKNAAKGDRGYHKYIPLPALSPNEVKTGSYIYLVLEQGMNSTLPGQVTARVTEDVYDTVSGCRLLIPALTKVVGSYDSKIALGQSRMLVIWNSMVFPDGEELNLAGMQGYDRAGMSGMESEVDNHYLRLFGLTFGMSMITAGMQMSTPPIPQSANGMYTPSPSQAIVTALTQQYGDLGAQLIGKYMAIQPTLTNNPGERFMIMVPHTIVFSKVWRNRCSVAQ